MESEFNLIYEPWIKVRNVERVSEVSLLEVLANAHEYTSLAGEMPTQDLAILRLLLAVLHSALYDTEVDYEEEDDIPINKWEFLWNNGCFPKDTITAYLERFKDRFWLFDDKHPFYQVADVEINKSPIFAKKFKGNLSQSENKIRLFSSMQGKEKESMTFPEAARWLVSFNAWDDSGARLKISESSYCIEHPTKYGWLGKLGNIYAIGDNLFETLMLNLVFDSPDTEQHPVWERDKPLSFNDKHYGTVTPDNQAELLTLLGRYMLLQRDEKNMESVVSVKTAIRYLVSHNGLQQVENMTLWSKDEKSDYSPKKHDLSVQIWREFSSIVPKATDGDHKPGIREWISKFTDDNQPLHDKVISFGICGVEYDGNGCSIVNSFGDSLTLHAALLSELGKEWDELISNEISECDKIAAWCEKMQKILILSKSPVPDKLDNINAQAKVVREKFYSLIDLSLRKWIESIDPQTDNPFDKHDEIRKTVSDIAKKYAAELAENAGAGAIIGRHGNDIFSKSKDAKRHYSSPEALNYFYGRIAKYMEGVDVGAK